MRKFYTHEIFTEFKLLHVTETVITVIHLKPIKTDVWAGLQAEGVELNDCRLNGLYLEHHNNHIHHTQTTRTTFGVFGVGVCICECVYVFEWVCV